MPLAYFLWGYLKDRVYLNKPETIEALKENIRREIIDIEPQICRNLIANFT